MVSPTAYFQEVLSKFPSMECVTSASLIVTHFFVTLSKFGWSTEEHIPYLDFATRRDLEFQLHAHRSRARNVLMTTA